MPETGATDPRGEATDPEAGTTGPEAGTTGPEAGATVEVALSDLRRRLQGELLDFRDQLPGIESERQVTDWGRSERVEGLVDRTVYDFLYRYWFRVEVQGIENVPSDGGALLAANHSGSMPSDGAMIAKAVREEHPRRRPVQIASERQLIAIPVLGMLFTKLGGVSAHPANVHRLLFDERQLLLVFPEGPRGASKPIKDRYRLRRFEDSGFVRDAARAGAPIVPVALVGAEEALPVFTRVRLLRRLTRLPHVPVTPVFPLPAKFRIRFLEPVATDGLSGVRERDQRRMRALGDEIRALIQENLLEMVGERRSVWLG
jgi:1-acyl-sn-glycerol-3-phosphate acyltransferase